MLSFEVNVHLPSFWLTRRCLSREEEGDGVEKWSPSFLLSLPLFFNHALCFPAVLTVLFPCSLLCCTPAEIPLEDFGGKEISAHATTYTYLWMTD